MEPSNLIRPFTNFMMHRTMKVEKMKKLGRKRITVHTYNCISTQLFVDIKIKENFQRPTSSAGASATHLALTRDMLCLSNLPVDKVEERNKSFYLKSAPTHCNHSTRNKNVLIKHSLDGHEQNLTSNLWFEEVGPCRRVVSLFFHLSFYAVSLAIYSYCSISEFFMCVY